MSMPVQYVTGKRVTTCSRCGFKMEEPVLLSMVPGTEPYLIGAHRPEGWHVVNSEWLCSARCARDAVAAIPNEKGRP